MEVSFHPPLSSEDILIIRLLSNLPSIAFADLQQVDIYMFPDPKGASGADQMNALVKYLTDAGVHPRSDPPSIILLHVWDTVFL